MLATEGLLEAFELFVLELDDLTTAQADEVVVGRVRVQVLVVNVLFAQVHLSEEPGLHEQCQGAIDGGFGDPDVFMVELKEQLVNFEVVMHAKGLLHDAAALRCQAQAFLSEIARERLFASRYRLEPLYWIAANRVCYFHSNNIAGQRKRRKWRRPMVVVEVGRCIKKGEGRRCCVLGSRVLHS